MSTEQGKRSKSFVVAVSSSKSKKKSCAIRARQGVRLALGIRALPKTGMGLSGPLFSVYILNTHCVDQKRMLLEACVAQMY